MVNKLRVIHVKGKCLPIMPWLGSLNYDECMLIIVTFLLEMVNVNLYNCGLLINPPHLIFTNLNDLQRLLKRDPLKLKVGKLQIKLLKP